MSDLISRQAAIDALKNRWKKTRNYEGNGDDIAEECELSLKQVPSAQPEQRWIPMKERCPEKDGRYLCTFQGKAVHICMYLNGCFRIYGENKDNLITAWMPLPEPYREEEQDEGMRKR